MAFPEVLATGRRMLLPPPSLSLPLSPSLSRPLPPSLSLSLPLSLSLAVFSLLAHSLFILHSVAFIHSFVALLFTKDWGTKEFNGVCFLTVNSSVYLSLQSTL